MSIFASAFAGSASAATVNRQAVSQSNSFLHVHDEESWPFSDEDRTFDMSNLGWRIVSPAVFNTDEGGDCGTVHLVLENADA